MFEHDNFVFGSYGP